MPRPSLTRRVAFVTGSAAFLLLLASLIFSREIAVEVHLYRLRAASRYLLEVVEARPGTAAAQALEGYLQTPEGQERLSRIFILELLGHLDAPGVEPASATLNVAEWDEADLEIRPLHYRRPAEVWWIIFSAEAAGGRKTRGSTKARSSLVALHRYLAELEPDGDEVVSLPEFPGMEFRLLPSGTELEGGTRCKARRVK